jgi:hypothetical protein
VIENPDPQEPWQVRTVAYHYTFGESGGNEILSYEEHPNVLGSVSFPHLHLQYGVGVGRSTFERVHLPTGLITLEATGLGGHSHRADPLIYL